MLPYVGWNRPIATTLQHGGLICGFDNQPNTNNLQVLGENDSDAIVFLD
jgi:hypothetical protein